jgi:hypothetical protein
MKRRQLLVNCRLLYYSNDTHRTYSRSTILRSAVHVFNYTHAILHIPTETTLLDILAGRKTDTNGRIEGDILFSDVNATSAYVMQVRTCIFVTNIH